MTPYMTLDFRLYDFRQYLATNKNKRKDLIYCTYHLIPSLYQIRLSCHVVELGMDSRHLLSKETQKIKLTLWSAVRVYVPFETIS